MEIQEGNRLIAEFMGAPYNNNAWYHGNNMYYHLRWGWLMPVVEKIEKWDHQVADVFIADRACDIVFSSMCNTNGEDYYAPSFRQNGETKIEATYKSVVQFITWYNQQSGNKG